jgi:hypothetical protein
MWLLLALLLQCSMAAVSAATVTTVATDNNSSMMPVFLAPRQLAAQHRWRNDVRLH